MALTVNPITHEALAYCDTWRLLITNYFPCPFSKVKIFQKQHYETPITIFGYKSLISWVICEFKLKSPYFKLQVISNKFDSLFLWLNQNTNCELISHVVRQKPAMRLFSRKTKSLVIPALNYSSNRAGNTNYLVFLTDTTGLQYVAPSFTDHMVHILLLIVWCSKRKSPMTISCHILV